jgi:hypothetical protein
MSHPYIRGNKDIPFWKLWYPIAALNIWASESGILWWHYDKFSIAYGDATIKHSSDEYYMTRRTGCYSESDVHFGTSDRDVQLSAVPATFIADSTFRCQLRALRVCDVHWSNSWQRRLLLWRRRIVVHIVLETTIQQSTGKVHCSTRNAGVHRSTP